MQNKLLSTLSKLVGTAPAGAGHAAARATPIAESSKIAYLSAMRIFRDLSPEEVKMIEASTVMTTTPKGKMIYMPGETGEVLFLLKKGSVHLYRLSSEGRKLIVQTVEPMTFFGEMALVGQNMHDLFAEAAEECTICVMSRADVERLLMMKPRVALRMLEEVSRRMHDAQERLGDSAFKGVPARVASLLLSLSDNGSKPLQGARHQDLADMMGVYRETVSNALGSFRDEGIIDLSRKEISILDPKRLREKAGEEVLRKR